MHQGEQKPKANEQNLVFLNAAQIGLIDAALLAIGDFGEVRLIKAKGKLRFIQKLQSQSLEAGPLFPKES